MVCRVPKRISAARLTLPLVCLLGASAATAGSLQDALTSAYMTSPDLEAERARTRATDETIAQSKAGYRPKVRADAIVGRRRIETDYESSATGLSSTSLGTSSGSDLTSSGGTTGTVDPTGVQISVEQNIFDGFRTSSAVSRSEAEVSAAQERLRYVEGQVLLMAASAYLDVWRDQNIVELRQKSLSILRREYSSIQARLKSSDATNADAAQTQARVAAAESDLELAKAGLMGSRAAYLQVVGHEPVGHFAPAQPYAHLLPSSLDEAMALAQSDNPEIQASLHREEADRYAVDEARADLLPKATVSASWLEAENPAPGVDHNSEGTVYAQLSVPIYEGGGIYAKVRQAKHAHVARQQEIRSATQQSIRSVTTAWAKLQAARSAIRSGGVRKKAAMTAFEGFKREASVGSRTIVDVLNAQNEMTDAEVALITAERDANAAQFELLAAIGRLDAVSLSLSDTTYDPEVHREEVRNKWIGSSITGGLFDREASAAATPSDINTAAKTDAAPADIAVAAADAPAKVDATPASAATNADTLPPVIVEKTEPSPSQHATTEPAPAPPEVADAPRQAQAAVEDQPLPPVIAASAEAADSTVLLQAATPPDGGEEEIMTELPPILADSARIAQAMQTQSESASTSAEDLSFARTDTAQPSAIQASVSSDEALPPIILESQVSAEALPPIIVDAVRDAVPASAKTLKKNKTLQSKLTMTQNETANSVVTTKPNLRASVFD